MKKLLLYSDSQHVGGHEIQAFNALKLLKDKYHLIVVVNSDNRYFIDLLETLNVDLVKVNYASSRLQFIRSFFSWKMIYENYRLIKSFKPNLILNVQGNIELGSVMLLSAKLSGVKVITYIPICHFLSEVTNRPVIGRVKDLLNCIYYRMVDGYITLNNFNVDLIRKRGVNCPISVVSNGINFTIGNSENMVQITEKLNINVNKINIALVGRVQFWHKGHDILISMVDKYRNQLKNYQFIIVGTGEDLDRFQLRISKLGLDEYFQLMGHIKDLSEVYTAIDGVIIPSRFESGAGTPLVLLESIIQKLPVIMSKLPEMESYLGGQHLFEVGDIDGIFKLLQSILSVKKQELDRRFDFVVNQHDMKKFHLDFLNAIEDFL